MASPFAVFRKNQKVLLAVTGILAMIAFVFLGTCVQTSGPVQAYQNPTIVSWKYGNVTASDMDQRRSMRRILNSFLVQAAQSAGQRYDPGFRDSEESIMTSMVLAQRGRDLGLVISDEMVNRQIAQLTNNRLRPADLESIISNYSVGGQRVTAKMIFDSLREEILANQAAMLFLDGLGADTPAQRWDYFRRFEQRLKAQVLPVPVAEFTEAKEIGKPTEEQLRELFEKHKQQFASPTRPEPGFRQPYRARFEYFEAGVEELVTAEMERVTEEEIKEYYEKHKDLQFRQSKLAPLDETKTDAKEDATKSEDSKETKGDAAAEEENSKEGKEKSTDGSKSGDAKSDEAKSEKTKSDEEKSDDAKSDEEKDKERGSDDASAKEPAADNSEVLLNRQFHLVNYQAGQSKQPSSNKATKPAESKKTGPTGTAAQPSKSAKDSSKATPDGKKTSPSATDKAGKTSDATGKGSVDEANKESPESKSDVKKAADEPSKKEESKKTDADKSEVKSDEAKDDAATKSEDGKGDKNSDDAKKDDASKPAPIEYKPLDEVRDTIRRAVATEHVRDQVEKRLAPLKSAMSRYSELRTRFQIESATNPDEPPPKPLDMQALAEEHGVKAFTTELLSPLDFEGRDDLDIAKSVDSNQRSPTWFMRWTDIVFQPKGLYRPLTTVVPGGGDSFLSWKTEEREGHVPDFEEVRGEVLEAWKRIQAREIARKKALEYAKTVREAKQPMKEVFALDLNLPVREVGPFSWLTRPSVPFGMMQQLPPPEWSKVPGVETPGQEFMESAFNLKADEVGVAFNHPKSVVYVIQAVEFDPLETVLQREFMVRMKNYERYRAAGIPETALAQNQWLESLFKDYEVHWERTPDVFMAAAE